MTPSFKIDIDIVYILYNILGAAFKNKKVEIQYSTITDATGVGSYENGNNGILLMHYIDWVK